ncbi:MAG TPA: carboxypeptidase-like regulatory domain-containing protein [Sphingobacteriaceae bacterium]
MRISAIILWLCFSALSAHPQDRLLSGRVYDLTTRSPLPGMLVSNAATGRQTATDSTGAFRFPAGIGDLLVFSGAGYQTDTILVINHADREVLMRPNNYLLKEVAISSATPNLGEYRHPDFHGQTVAYQRDEDGNPVGGLIFRISYWNKDSRKERRSKKRLAQARLESEIYELFSPLNIGKYIPLKGQALQNFIDLYRPPVNLYRSGGFELVLYLNDKYREYLALPEAQRRLPPLK